MFIINYFTLFCSYFALFFLILLSWIIFRKSVDTNWHSTASLICSKMQNCYDFYHSIYATDNHWFSSLLFDFLVSHFISQLIYLFTYLLTYLFILYIPYTVTYSLAYLLFFALICTLFFCSTSLLTLSSRLINPYF